ncbi:Sec-independent protein translocase protein TatB [Lysobacter gummosus]|uniref:Sec-independent protein translocase protein TatB n=1 Tax=Lysobacter gummosus TaxID=262324 RepID=UPI003633910B
MFDIGFSEVFVIAIVALIVLGPERLPKAARFAGLWVRRARAVVFGQVRARERAGRRRTQAQPAPGPGRSASGAGATAQQRSGRAQRSR